MKAHINPQSMILQRINCDDEGATAVEYGLMVALIAVAIIAAVMALGTGLTETFNDVTVKLGVVDPPPA